MGLVIGHVGPEAAVGGPIGLVEDGDTVRVDLNNNELICEQLEDEKTYNKRKEEWDKETGKNGGTHPPAGEVNTRLLNRMRSSAVSAVYGAGMHPGRSVWVNDPRKTELSEFKPTNKFKE